MGLCEMTTPQLDVGLKQRLTEPHHLVRIEYEYRSKILGLQP